MASDQKDPLKKSKYSDALRIAAIAQYDVSGQLRATAKDFGIPHNTLSDWIKSREKGELDVVDLEPRIELTKRKLIDRSVTIMDKALDQIEKTLDKCSAPQAATVYGILHDKMAAMQGQITGSETGNVTNNFIIGMPSAEQVNLLTRVTNRMHGKDVVEAVGEVIGEDNISGDSED